MKTICVDDERLLMEYTLTLCEEVSGLDHVKGFTHPLEAAEWAEQNAIDLALLDLNMPGMGGIELAARLKALHPEIMILFLTGYSHYMSGTTAGHAPGYLMKPVAKAQLESEIACIRALPLPIPEPGIFVQTFGRFAVYSEGQALPFSDPQCLEALAFLVDHHGESITRAELAERLWPQTAVDRGLLKKTDQLIAALQKDLKRHGIAHIAALRRANLSICPDTFSCDAYSFFNGSGEHINRYRGNYLAAYSWADFPRSVRTWSFQNGA